MNKKGVRATITSCVNTENEKTLESSDMDDEAPVGKADAMPGNEKANNMMTNSTGRRSAVKTASFREDTTFSPSRDAPASPSVRIDSAAAATKEAPTLTSLRAAKIMDSASMPLAAVS